MKPRPIFQSFSSSGSLQISRRRFAMTRHAVGDMINPDPLAPEFLSGD